MPDIISPPSDSNACPDADPLLRDQVEAIFRHAIAAVLPETALQRHVALDAKTNRLMVAGRAYDLNAFRRILVVGGGKAARHTGEALAALLGERVTAGVLNVFRNQAALPIHPRINLIAADHPTPNEAGAEGARQMFSLLGGADAKTLVMALISGGGSALMALPAPGISLADYQMVNDLLLTVPAAIDEINAVRKHLDSLKGGGLRKAARQAGAFVSLVLSDVPVTRTGIVDDPEVIASGPTVGDASTFVTAKRVLTEHRLWKRIPETVRAYIEANQGRVEWETLRKDSPLLEEARNQYCLIANNDLAMEAAGQKARELGYAVELIGCRTGRTTDKLQGEVQEAMEWLWGILTPQIGPNVRVTMACLSTDGVDGHADLAGALADDDTLVQAHKAGLDPRPFLDAYDSASFFERIGGGIRTGPTGTNVADLIVVLLTDPGRSEYRRALIFGGETTVRVKLPAGQSPGSGGRNTHLALLAVQKLARRREGSRVSIQSPHL